MNSNSHELKSRWGYHPCEYALYVKLKQLHKWYWQTVYDFHRWYRWWRKAEQNRRGPRPAYCETFVEEATWLEPVRHPDTLPTYAKRVVDRGVVELYHTARRPQAEPVPEFSIETRAAIDAVYEIVAEYFRCKVRTAADQPAVEPDRRSDWDETPSESWRDSST